MMSIKDVQRLGVDHLALLPMMESHMMIMDIINRGRFSSNGEAMAMMGAMCSNSSNVSFLVFSSPYTWDLLFFRSSELCDVCNIKLRPI